MEVYSARIACDGLLMCYKWEDLRNSHKRIATFFVFVVHALRIVLYCSMYLRLRKYAKVAPLQVHPVQNEWVQVKPVQVPVKRELVHVKTTYVVRDNWIQVARVNGS